MAAGGLAAILMTLVMELAEPKRRRIKTKLEVESLPRIDTFLSEFAKDRRWGPTATNRLRAAAEESILSLLPDEDSPKPEDMRHLLLVARGDRRAVELEFFAAPVEKNLEDQLTLLGHWTERSGSQRILATATPPIREFRSPPAVLRYRHRYGARGRRHRGAPTGLKRGDRRGFAARSASRAVPSECGRCHS